MHERKSSNVDSFIIYEASVLQNVKHKSDVDCLRSTSVPASVLVSDQTQRRLERFVLARVPLGVIDAGCLCCFGLN
jgi:hypothetical protein